MIKSFVKIACRILYKNKLFTILNVVGMALGMYLSLLFIALLAFLFRFDDFHPHKERIYRVTTQVNDKKDTPRYASAPIALAQKLENNFTGVEKVARIHRSLYGEAIYGEKKIELAGYFADPGFFEIFNFPLVEGSPATALSRPNTLVLTETEAKKIFGSKDALGEMIRLEGYGNFLVTGILKDLPKTLICSLKLLLLLPHYHLIKELLLYRLKKAGVPLMAHMYTCLFQKTRRH